MFLWQDWPPNSAWVQRSGGTPRCKSVESFCLFTTNWCCWLRFCDENKKTGEQWRPYRRSETELYLVLQQHFKKCHKRLVNGFMFKVNFFNWISRSWCKKKKKLWMTPVCVAWCMCLHRDIVWSVSVHSMRWEWLSTLPHNIFIQPPKRFLLTIPMGYLDYLYFVWVSPPVRDSSILWKNQTIKTTSTQPFSAGLPTLQLSVPVFPTYSETFPWAQSPESYLPSLETSNISWIAWLHCLSLSPVPSLINPLKINLLTFLLLSESFEFRDSELWFKMMLSKKDIWYN